MLGARSKAILKYQGQFFKDLNGNGQIDPYENWRLSVDERIDVGPYVAEQFVERHVQHVLDLGRIHLLAAGVDALAAAAEQALRKAA